MLFTPTETPPREEHIYRVIYRLVEDLQRVRISHGHRIRQALPLIPGTVVPPRGSESWKAFFEHSAEALQSEERRVLSLVHKLLKHDPLGSWLLSQRGIGPALAVSILGECMPLERFKNPSKLWAYAGLHVIDGKAARRQKGQRANWNTRLKTRMYLFAVSVLRAGDSPWRALYDQRRVHEAARAGGAPVDTDALQEIVPAEPLRLIVQHKRALRIVEKALLLDLWRVAHGEVPRVGDDGENKEGMR